MNRLQRVCGDCRVSRSSLPSRLFSWSSFGFSFGVFEEHYGARLSMQLGLPPLLSVLVCSSEMFLTRGFSLASNSPNFRIAGNSAARSLPVFPTIDVVPTLCNDDCRPETASDRLKEYEYGIDSFDRALGSSRRSDNPRDPVRPPHGHLIHNSLCAARCVSDLLLSAADRRDDQPPCSPLGTGAPPHYSEERERRRHDALANALVRECG